MKIYQREPAIVIFTKTGQPVRYYITLIAIILPYLCFGQITSPSPGEIRYTTYPSAPLKQDPIFITCNETGTIKGSLNAASPGGTGPFTFTWYSWSDITKSFSNFIRTDSPVFSSSLTSLSEGGYKVNISDGTGYDTSLVAWVHLDKPYAEAKLQNFTCDYVALSGKAAIDTFYYRDPAGGASVKLRNAFRFMWSSDPASTIPFPNLELNPVTFDPPLVDVVYKLQVTDSFQCVSESSFPYTSIHVKADFTVDPQNGEAPLEVTVTDKSIRAELYKWEFGDDSVSLLSSPPPHIYYRPGEYKVKLTVESDKHCVDSMIFDKVVVDPSELNIPNVFSPNGDGINDFFIVQAKSLRTISVEVFTRSGVMVYSYYADGTPMENWEGWDGNVNKTSAKASPGVYFYIIRARGWDDKVYDSKEYRGFVYLYR